MSWASSFDRFLRRFGPKWPHVATLLLAWHRWGQILSRCLL